MITWSSGSIKTNALLNSIRAQYSDLLIDKIYIYAKDLNKPKYQYLIKKREKYECVQMNQIQKHW